MRAGCDASHVLIRAKGLITDPAKWTAGTVARGSDGEPVCPADASAVSFCAVGALMRASVEFGCEHKDDQEVWEIMGVAIGIGRHWSIGHVRYRLSNLNDSPKTDHATVMSQFDRAIAACR